MLSRCDVEPRLVYKAYVKNAVSKNRSSRLKVAIDCKNLEQLFGNGCARACRSDVQTSIPAMMLSQREMAANILRPHNAGLLEIFLGMFHMIEGIM